MSEPFAPPYPEQDLPAGERLRVPPHSIQAEQSLIGGLMLDNQTWDSVADKVSNGFAPTGARACRFSGVAV